MMEEYTKKVIEPSVTKKVKEVLPIFQKRQHWCFRFEGLLYKFSTEAEAKTKYKELNK
jgi:hypothetical protein